MVIIGSIDSGGPKATMWEHLTRPVHRCQHRHNQRIQKRDALSVEKADNWLHQCGFSMEMMEELHGITVEHAAMNYMELLLNMPQ